MTPRSFLETVAKPAIEEATADPLSLHKTIGAIAICDMLAAHIFTSKRSDGSLDDLSGKFAKDDDRFRDHLASKSQAFKLLRDVAKAQKHVLLQRCKDSRLVTHASQVKVTSLGFGVGSFGEGPYGGTDQIVVEADDGSIRNVLALLGEVILFLEGEII